MSIKEKITNWKFIKRFNFLEEELNKRNETFSEASFEELDSLWDQSKKLS